MRLRVGTPSRAPNAQLMKLLGFALVDQLFELGISQRQGAIYVQMKVESRDGGRCGLQDADDASEPTAVAMSTQ